MFVQHLLINLWKISPYLIWANPQFPYENIQKTCIPLFIFPCGQIKSYRGHCFPPLFPLNPAMTYLSRPQSQMMASEVLGPFLGGANCTKMQVQMDSKQPVKGRLGWSQRERVCQLPRYNCTRQWRASLSPSEKGASLFRISKKLSFGDAVQT